MSDPVQSFEFVLKNQSPKKTLALYGANETANKHTYKPQDVISSVSTQLRAIQMADTLKSYRKCPKELNKYKQTEFLCVNKLPVYEQIPKSHTKFDTQCVTDTQLINVIEDAEVLYAHQGMTQEFETTFIHNTDKYEQESSVKRNDTCTAGNDETNNLDINCDKDLVNKNTAKEINDAIDFKNNNTTIDFLNTQQTDSVRSRPSREMIDKDKDVDSDSIQNVKDIEISQILKPKTFSKRLIMNKEFYSCKKYSIEDANTQIEDYNQLPLIEHTEIQDSDDTDRPLSPILCNKDLQANLETPAPLVFNLDDFERFESIIVPIIDYTDMETVKNIINSQILHKELHIQIHEDIKLKKMDIPREEIDNDKNEGSLIQHTDPKLIQKGKVPSETILHELINVNIPKNDKITSELCSEVLKDEILFSSDEENSNTKDFQDLPFTCALETSLYNQSDILDKTMYVGFQTASNKSIQVCADSFNKAKSLLTDVSDDNVTVTELVRSCDDAIIDHSINKKVCLNTGDMVFNSSGHIIENPGHHRKNNDTEINTECEIQSTNIISQHYNSNKLQEFSNFNTTNESTRSLSENVSPRYICRDNNLNQNYETSQKDLPKTNIDQKMPHCFDRGEIKNLVDDVLQCIDDDIIQEFENTEMSFEEEKKENIKTGSLEIEIKDNQLKSVPNQNKDFFLDTADNIHSNNSQEKYKVDDKALMKVSGELKINKDAMIHMEGFKTASNKNINISVHAWTKSKSILENIDLMKFPDKHLKDSKKINKLSIEQNFTENTDSITFDRVPNMQDVDYAFVQAKNISNDCSAYQLDAPKNTKTLSTDFINVGFKTANNKNINISAKAWSKTKNIFDDIDFFKLPNEANKDYPDAEIVNKTKQEDVSDMHYCCIDTSLFALTSYNNKTTDTSILRERVTRPSNSYEDSDLSDCSKLPEQINNKRHQIIKKNKTVKHLIDTDVAIKNYDRVLSSNILGSIGFKTASNKYINISDKALIRTRNVFKNIDSDEIKLSNKVVNEYCNEIHNDINVVDNINVDDIMKLPSFKMASDKVIKVSSDSLLKSKRKFSDVNDNFRGSHKIDKKHDFRLKDSTNCKDGLKTRPSSPLPICQTVNNNPGTISDGTLGKENNIFDNCTTEIPLNKFEPFSGFQTASNKQVKISEKALVDSRRILNDIGVLDDKNVKNKHRKIKGLYPEEIFQYDDICNNDVQTNLRTNKVVNEYCNEIHNDINVDDIMKFPSFKTAIDKVIKVSSDSLLKSKRIFSDFNDNFRGSHKIEKKYDFGVKDSTNSNDKLKTRPSSLLPICQTVNNNPSTISEGTLGKENNIFDNCNTEILLNKFEPFSGFQTASNKQVKISEKALVNSRRILNDIGVLDDKNDENKHKKIKGLYPEEIFQYDDICDNDVQTNIRTRDKLTASIFEGFHTANNNTVSVSKCVLEKSKKLFQSINNMNQTKSNFTEYVPDNNEVINISNEHIVATRDSNAVVNKVEGFKGFQTANNNNVIVSEKALAETKNIFKDLENEYMHDVKINFGFQTGNNKAISVSREALAKSKRLFAEIDDERHTESSKKEKKEPSNGLDEENIDCLIDNEVINNFDETLHTEDFRDTPTKSKRSGSPILLCSRIKKRKKFETPYKLETISELTPKLLNRNKIDEKIMYKDNYKKGKKYTLKDLKEISKDIDTKIDPYLLEFNYDTLLQFELKHGRNDLTQGNMTLDLLKEYFLRTANSKLIPKDWLDNHLRLILWKLISYEIVFKSIFCTAKNVLEQLNYRYIKELYNAERPALRKILEKDDVPSKTMVLCVVQIYVDGVSVSSVTNSTSNIELLVTDGWYCIRCKIDRMLADLVVSNKIRVGCKIITTGAELMGCEQGVSPWEDTSAVRLKIFGNSTRRARWDARLGYHAAAAMLTQLSSVKVLGGKVSKLRAFVTRVYPALYVEKFEDGSTVTRSERLENLHQMKTEADRETFMEKIYEEVEKEFADRVSQDSESLPDSCKITMDSGSQIAKMMKRNKDPGEFRAQLTHSQKRLLEEHTTKKQDRLLQEIQARVKERIEKASVCVNRNVVSLVKIRIAGIREIGDDIEVTKGMLSIWKPNDAVQDIIREGAWIDVMNVVPTSTRNGEMQISAGRQSIFSTSKFKLSEKIKHHTTLLQRQCYSIKVLAQNPAMATNFNEIDTVGLIFLIDPEKDIFDSTKQSFQNVYLCDADKNMICVNFWGGLKKVGFHNVLDTGQAVSCVNLQKRAGNTRRSIPQYRVTEFSYFTQMPRNDNTRKILEELNKKLSCLDRRKLCQECMVLKNNYAVLKQNSENVSPYRFMNNSDVNISKNKLFIDSPLHKSDIQEDLNLTGLDFESTFKESSQLSEEVLKRRRKVNEKIARLKMYGEPPPLAPMHIINSSIHASTSYKSPLISNNKSAIHITNNNTPENVHQNHLIPNSKSDNDSSVNVVNFKNTPQLCGDINCEINNSPVLLNKTFVKSVNPMKINFDAIEDNEDSNIDHFADEFDGSPPLSLD